MKNNVIQIVPNTIHVWRVFLPEFFVQKDELKKLLNPLEISRANRFKFTIHHDRFVVARAMLRKILNLYTNIDPDQIEFGYEDRGKPYLPNNSHNIQFNLSHSDDWAVFAVAKEIELGIDIEKMQDSYKEGVATRFFSEQENQALSQLPATRRAEAFYQIWVRKEAVIKLLGEGLYTSLSDFSVCWDQKNEKIILPEASIWLSNLKITPVFPGALATRVLVHDIKYWRWDSTGFCSIME